MLNYQRVIDISTEKKLKVQVWVSGTLSVQQALPTWETQLGGQPHQLFLDQTKHVRRM